MNAKVFEAEYVWDAAIKSHFVIVVRMGVASGSFEPTLYLKFKQATSFLASVMLDEMKQNYLFRKMKNFLYRFCHEPCSLHEAICMLHDDMEN